MQPLNVLYIPDAGKDHTDCDCFAMAVLSHGDEGQVFGTDEAMQIKKLVEPLKQCESLRGKPKLFFVQVCTSAGHNWQYTYILYEIIMIIINICVVP